MSTGGIFFTLSLIMKLCFFFLTLSVVCFSSSCVWKEADEPKQANLPEARFTAPWLPGGGMSLYFQASGEPLPVQEEIQNFVTIARRQFAEKGIPAGAITAVGFLEAGDPREDFQFAYAIEEEGEIRVYRGYIVPGFGGPVEWERVRFRSS